MPAGRVYLFGGFRLDAHERLLLCEGRPVPLTSKAFDTLLALVERSGRLVTKDELLRSVWPDAFVEENNLAQAISAVRRALAKGEGGEALIETVPKRGYRFVGSVETESVEAAGGAPDPIEPAPPLRGGPGIDRDAPDGGRRPLRAGARAVGAIAAVVVAGTVWWSSGGAPPPAPEAARPGGVTRIAVLPFLNLGSPEHDVFVAGLTEEITARLASVRGLALPSSTTIGGYDRAGKTLERLGADLRVDYVIEGAVRWSAGRESPLVRITPKLVRVADDTTVWTDQYDALLPDLFSVQVDIAQQVAGVLQVTLDADEQRRVSAGSTEHTDAYLAYLRGVAAYGLGTFDTANQLKALAEFERAVAIDTRFAPGWSALARVYAEQYSSGVSRSPETLQAAYRAAETALSLDQGSTDAHLALARVYGTDGKFDRARAELNVVQAAAPNAVEAWHVTAGLLQLEGDWRGAQDAYRRAFDLDPVSTADLIGVHYLNLRDYTEARRYIDVALAANRTGAVVPDAWRRFSQTGDIDAARQVLESDMAARTPPDARARGLLARLEWFAGRHERALALIDEMDAAGAWLSPSFRFPAALAAGQVLEDAGQRAAAEARYAAAAEQLAAAQRLAPDDDGVEAAMGLAVAGLGHSEDAARRMRRAIELVRARRNAARLALYRYFLAQIQSRAGSHDAALATLDEMFRDPSVYNEWWVRHEPWLASLRSHPEFERRMAEWRTRSGDRLLASR